MPLPPPPPNSYLILFAVFLVLWIPRLCEAESPPLPAAVGERLEDLLSEGDLTTASVYSASSLAVWKDDLDFLDVVRRIETLYAYLDEDIAQAELERRLWVLSESPPGMHHVDAALLARRFHRRQGLSRDCLLTALNDADLSSNPYLHALLGRAHLALHHIAPATEAFVRAVELAQAMNDPAAAFRVRQMYATEFFQKFLIDQAYQAALPTLDSDYPLERAWGLSQKILYEQSKERKEAAIRAFLELKEMWLGVSPRPDSDWQKRKHEDIDFIVKTMERTLAEDPVAEIILAVEALDYNYRALDADEGLKALRPIVNKYPIEDYPTWSDPELREWLVWTHYNYCVCLDNAVSSVESEAALERVLAVVPFEDYPARVVEMYLWLGFAREILGKDLEAMEAYEKGFELDVAHLEAASRPEFPTDPFQHRVKDALLSPRQRSLFMGSYERLVRRVAQSGGEVGQ